MFDEVARALTENGYSVHCFATGAEAAAWLKGEPMPKAPKWHLWVKRENRRS